MNVKSVPSDAALARLLELHPKRIDLVLDRIERLLAALGHPEDVLPPVIHVAGTNGKGSVCAFLRAMLEGSGQRVHLYSSPHLVRFHERICLAGLPISEDALSAILEECESANDGKQITFFEITTAAAFLAFSRVPADALVLEVGLGGIFDATNVVRAPVATCITPIAHDHQEFLGSDLAGIAREKAGILKAGAPCILGRQTDEVREIVSNHAQSLGAPLFVEGEDFDGYEEHGRFVYQDEFGLLDLPRPKLAGRHQISNAAIAVACLRQLSAEKSRAHWAEERAIERGLENVEWPGRMQRLKRGPLVELAPEGAEIWLDGGHNPHGAAAIAQFMADREEQTQRPLYLVCGLLQTKDVPGFFAPFSGLTRHVTTISIEGEASSHGSGSLCDIARVAGLEATPAAGLGDAMKQISALARSRPGEGSPRILICGSLYLAGQVLMENA
jgi:dihydrofolate synthase/folylpolyglutamate synthase